MYEYRYTDFIEIEIIENNEESIVNIGISEKMPIMWFYTMTKIPGIE